MSEPFVAGLSRAAPPRALTGLEAVIFPADQPLLFAVGHPLGVFGVGEEIRTGHVAVGQVDVTLDIASSRLWEAALTPRAREPLLMAPRLRPAELERGMPPFRAILENLESRHLVVGISRVADENLSVLGRLSLVPLGRGVAEAPDWTFLDITTTAGIVRLGFPQFFAWEQAHLVPKVSELARLMMDRLGDWDELHCLQTIVDGLPTMVYADALRLDLSLPFGGLPRGARHDLATDYPLWSPTASELGASRE